MMQQTIPPVQDLVLVGGGHSHAIALRMWGMNPVPGVRLTLISEASDTPYSGMLPGHVAGYYNREACYIDLRALAQFAGAQFYVDRVTGLDLVAKRVYCAKHPPVRFDWLSLDIGSTPAVPDRAGIFAQASWSIPVKPIGQFLARWYQVLEQIQTNPNRSWRLGVVGGGVSGVELTLALERRLSQLSRQMGHDSEIEIHLFQHDQVLMPGHAAWVQQRVANLLHDRGVIVHLRERVYQASSGSDADLPQPEVLDSNLSQSSIAVTYQDSLDLTGNVAQPLSSASAILQCESGLAIACDYVFWVTQAKAQPWLRSAGLAVDDGGFVQVGDTLQSISHPQVLATGDIAVMVNYPRPKAGVFAVRQGKPLFHNLTRLIQGKSPQTYRPQQRYLNLIGTAAGGHPTAIASYGKFYGESRLLWYWKDWIDRRFMARFQNLPVMGDQSKSPWWQRLWRSLIAFQQTTLDFQQTTSERQVELSGMHCAGCGSKVGSAVLTQVLHRLRSDWPETIQPEGLKLGLAAAEDAAVIKIPDDRDLVQSVDYFRALVSDPYLFGQIATNHCLGDLYAMGATPHSALAIATLPYSRDSLIAETLYQLLAGVVEKLQQAGAALIGGHTVEGSELALGLTCNGLIMPDRLLRKGSLGAGEALLLTKPLGTGTLFAAQMRGQARNDWIDEAIATMLQSSQNVLSSLRDCTVTACTDVTGFGLLGHLGEMIQAQANPAVSKGQGATIGVELDLSAIPLLTGAAETLRRGIFSSLAPQNRQAEYLLQDSKTAAQNPRYPILFDPQTCGGLLLAVPLSQSDRCLFALQQAGYQQASIIGRTKTISPGEPPIWIWA